MFIEDYRKKKKKLKKKKKKKTEKGWSVGFIPLETINLNLENNYKSDLNFLFVG